MSLHYTPAQIRRLSERQRALFEAAALRAGVSLKGSCRPTQHQRIDEYIRKSAAKRPASISITLNRTLMSLNQWQRMHYTARGAYLRRLAMELWVLAGAWRYPPYERAKLIVVRYSSGQLDETNLQGSVKALEDVLQPQSTRHPYGLGIIADDSPDALVREITQAKTAPSAGRTEITISGE